MYKLIKNENELKLEYCGKTVFVHTEDRPFISVGHKKLYYKSSHGSFKVTTLGKGKRVDLKNYEIREEGVYFYNDRVSVRVFFEEKNGLNMTFEKQGDFENISFNFEASATECIFGGGEQYRKLNLKGEKVINFVSEHIKVKPIVDKVLWGKIKKYRVRKHSEIESYSPMSTFVSSERYAIKVHTNSYGINEFDKEKSILRYWQMPERITYFLAESYKELSKLLNQDIPCREYLPDWAYDGMIIGVQGGIDKTIKNAEEMILAGAKICGVWCQDWSGKKVTAAGKQVYWNWEVDNKLYPDLEEKIKRLKKKGVRFLAYINPYLIKDGEMYNYCKNKGYLIKNQKGEVYHIKSTTFDAGMMDLTHPEMVNYLKNTIIKKNMLDLGIDGYMADFGEYLPVDSYLYSEEDARLLHNDWPVIWAKINREAIEESGRGEEIFFFTRSGYNGAQSYTTIMWNGDQHTDYTVDYGMPCVIPATLNLGFSGLAAAHSDIAGFISFASLKRDAELFIRWMEMNTFSPLMRTHETIRPEANAQYNDERVMPYSIKLSNVRKILKPYIKACMEDAQKGIPVMRAPFYEYNDINEYNSDYVYMLGSDIFVNPVLTPSTNKVDAILPPGNWKHIFTGEDYKGGRHTISAELGTPAVFYKTDSAFADIFKEIEKIK